VPVGEAWELPLSELITGARHDAELLTIDVSATDHLQGGVSGDAIYVLPEPGWAGSGSVTVTVQDGCAQATLSFPISVGLRPGRCATTFSYTPQRTTSSVSVAGDFSDWGALPLDLQPDGTWTSELLLAPGDHAYRFIEDAGATCDPLAADASCLPGDPDATWDDCRPGAPSCASLVHVADCEQPALALTELHIDRTAGRVRATVVATPALDGADVDQLTATLDGAAVATTGAGTAADPLQIDLSALTGARHRLLVSATDTAGRTTASVTVPFWLDDASWDGGVLYFPFTDRFADGDPSNNAPQGTVPAMDYQGGDWAGLRDHLPYLQTLGVTALWLSPILDNADGTWGQQCDAAATGYHGYWPTDPAALEPNFGDEAALRALIDDAHQRGMRVLIDWVGNHVHQDHPYAQQHPEWFNPEAICRDADNWNTIPESCWFDAFLPDLDYRQTAVQERVVADAIAMATAWDVDGLRVDAVKHMPHSLHAHLAASVEASLEHTAVGGDQDFLLLGETFDGNPSALSAWLGPRQLDGQFDFSLYFALRQVLLEHSRPLSDLGDALLVPESTFAGSTMSAFLGNHDVARFATEASDQDIGACDPNGTLGTPAGAPLPAAYELLGQAWSIVLTQPGLSLVYYGDELGLPGRTDPDNREPMRFTNLSGDEARVLDQVQRLGVARGQHPALWSGETRIWWIDTDVLAWARASGGDAMIGAINLADQPHELANGLAWAGLPQGGAWQNLLTDEVNTAHGDQIVLTVPAHGSAVWVAL